MRRLFRLLPVCMLLLAAFPAFAQLAAVTGTVTDAGGVGVPNAYLQFDLYGCGGNRPRWTGGVVSSSVQLYGDANGAVTGNVVRNDQITCANTVGNTTYFVQQFINGQPSGPRLQYQINAATFNWNTQVAITQAPVVTPPNGDTVYARLDGGNMPFTGTVTHGGHDDTGIGTLGAVTGNFSANVVTGLSSLTNVNGVINAGNFATFALALAACPNPGTLSISSAISVSANASVPSTCTLLFLKPGVLNIATATTVTINSAIIAPEDAQIFALTGTGAVAGLLGAYPEWFGGQTSAATLAAYNSLSSSGGIIQLRNLGAATEYDFSWTGTHATEITKSNVEIAGRGRAEYNSQTAPTGYTGGGTVVKGPIWVKSEPAGPANGFRIHDLSVDNINGTTGADGIFVNNNFPSGSTDGPPFIEGVRIRNVRTLGHLASSAFHSILCDNCDGAQIEDTETIFNIYGVVIKGQRTKLSGQYGRGHNSACAYVKSDSGFGIALDTSLTHIKCEQLASAGDTAGILYDSQLTQTSKGLTITGFHCRGTAFCFNVLDTNAIVADFTLTNFIIDGTTGAPIGIGSSASGAVRGVISNGIINSASGNGINLNSTSSDITVHDITCTNLSSGDCVHSAGANNIIHHISAITTSGCVVNVVSGTASVDESTITGRSNTGGLVCGNLGIAPTCSVTGAGASATCVFGTNSTNTGGLIRIGSAGAGPAASGTLTITLNTVFGTPKNSIQCVIMPANTSSAWNSRAAFQQNSFSNTVPVFAWDNNAVALVAGNNYDMSYLCKLL